MQPARDLHRLAQRLGALLQGLIAAAGRHRLDVAAGAESAAGAGQHDDTDVRIRRQLEVRAEIASLETGSVDPEDLRRIAQDLGDAAGRVVFDEDAV